MLKKGGAPVDPLICCRGFTLMEIMLATLILAMVVSMITLSLSGSLRVVEATRDQGDLYYRAQVAMQRISNDLESAILKGGAEFVGHSVESVENVRPLLDFVSMAHLVFDPEHGQRGMGEISYLLAPDPEDSEQLLLLRRDRLEAPHEKKEAAELAGKDAFLLSDHLRSVVFTYIDAEGEEHESWDTRVDPDAGAEEKKRKHRLPAAVACTLEYWLDRERETTLRFQTKVTIPPGMITVYEQ